jgi:hypothetical protein
MKMRVRNRPLSYPSRFFISYICDLFSSFMCGRYRRTTQEEELARLYHIPIPRQTDLPISYRTESEGSYHSLQSRNATAIARRPAMGIDSILG